IIGTTAEHPFFVVGKGCFVPAGELEPGEVFLSDDGQLVAVEKVHDTGRSETVYNLHIADFHTYFVGGEDWGFSVWAHNACQVTTKWAIRRWLQDQARIGRGAKLMR